MPEDLRQRLREVLSTHTMDATETRDDRAIAAIHQAYTEAGYTNTPRIEMYTDNRLRAENFRLRTGQEWYQRFLDELHKLPEQDKAAFKEDTVVRAAKKAAGLS